MIKDMTEGNPSKMIVAYSIPIILSGMFQQFYNIADSVIAGKYAGVDALAAVGASYPITMLFIAVAAGASIGASVVISQIFGAKEYTKMKTAAFTAVTSILVLSVFLTAVGQIANNGLIRLMNTPEDVYQNGALYLRIYFAGLVFLFLYNIANAVFNALGDSKTPLYFLIVSSLTNIILDYIFVAIFKMGVAGVAWATFLAQGLASLLAMLTLLKRLHKIKTEEKARYFDQNLLRQMSKIAIPSIFQQSVVSIGQLMIQALVNSYGSTVIAGYSAAIKLDSFFKMTIQSMGNAVSSFSAQNAGAKKLDRIKRGYVSTLKIGIGYSIISVIIIRLAGYGMVSWFVSSDTDAAVREQVLAVGTSYMNVVAVFYIAFVILMVSTGLMRGVGYMPGFTTITFVDLVIRVAVTYILAYVIGYEAIWWAIGIGWICGMIQSYFFLKYGNWRSGMVK